MFQQRLGMEFATRKQANSRYSLRAFARFLGIDHSTLSQVLKGSRRATVKQIRTVGRKLGMPAEEITIYIAAEHVPDASTAQRQEQLRHWTAEAIAVMREKVHWEIVRMCRDPAFRPDCRWIAAQAGVSVDEVNLSLTRLLRLGLIDGQWRDVTGLEPLTERAFRRLALAKVRQRGVGKD